MRTAMRLVALGCAGVLALAGCSAGSADSADGSAADTSYDDSAGAAPGAAPEEAPADVDSGVRDEGEAGMPDLNLSSTDRSVITTGSVTMTVEDPEAAVRELSQLVEGMGGWVEGLHLQAASENVDASASMILRIPSREVTSTLDRLDGLGTVEDVNLNRSDVTMQVRDLEARIRALKLSIARMEALLERATTTNDLVNAEQMLTDRQSQLESLLSQQAVLADQVSMSTLEVQLWAPDALPEPEPEPPSGFWGGLVTGWNAFLDFGGAMLLVLGVLLPWLVFAALITAAIVAIVRWNRRRQAATALPAAHPGYAGPPPGQPWPGGYPQAGQAPPPPAQPEPVATPTPEPAPPARAPRRKTPPPA